MAKNLSLGLCLCALTLSLVSGSSGDYVEGCELTDGNTCGAVAGPQALLQRSAKMSEDAGANMNTGSEDELEDDTEMEQDMETTGRRRYVNVNRRRDGRRRRSRRRATTTPTPTYTERSVSYSMSQRPKLYSKSGFKIYLDVEFAFSFTLNKDNACGIAFSSTGHVELDAEYDTGVKKFKQDVTLLEGPNWDVSTERIIAEQCKNNQCVYFKLTNLGGCNFDSWKIEAKVTGKLSSYSVSSGYKTLATVSF
jgi:hypothetical protein